jgi:hypothetical protein
VVGIGGRRKPRLRYDLSNGADLAEQSASSPVRSGGKGFSTGVRLLAGVMSLVGGGIFGWLGGWYAVRDVALSGDRPTADATVLEHHHNSRGPGISSVDVEFVTADGRRVRATVDEFASPVPTVGGSMRVRYDPRHPNWFARDVRQGPSVVLPVVSALMTLLAASALVFVTGRGGRSSSNGSAGSTTRSPPRPDATRREPSPAEPGER